MKNQEIIAEEVGKVSMQLGAGRVRKEDPILPEVGLQLVKKIGDKVGKGEILAYIHANDEERAKKAQAELTQIYQIVPEEQAKQPVILDII